MKEHRWTDASLYLSHLHLRIMRGEIGLGDRETEREICIVASP